MTVSAVLTLSKKKKQKCLSWASVVSTSKMAECAGHISVLIISHSNIGKLGRRCWWWTCSLCSYFFTTFIERSRGMVKINPTSTNVTIWVHGLFQLVDFILKGRITLGLKTWKNRVFAIDREKKGSSTSFHFFKNQFLFAYKQKVMMKHPSK